MSSTYLYTFIIPHHNCPTLLNRCLDSIPQREDIQIIVVDDNSAEDKRPCIKRDDVEVIYIDAEHTKGAGRARNYGLKAAKGKWLLFADCDDYYAYGFIDIFDDYINSNADVIYYSCNYVDGKSGEILPPIYISQITSNYNGDEETEIPLRYMNNVPWSKMIKRSFVLNGQFEYEEIINGNDYLFSLMIGHHARKIAVINKPIYVYNRNAASITNKRRMTDTELLCKIRYIIQRKYLFKKLNIKGNETSLIIFLLHIFRRKGIIMLYKSVKILTCNLIELYKNRLYYYEMLYR